MGQLTDSLGKSEAEARCQLYGQIVAERRQREESGISQERDSQATRYSPWTSQQTSPKAQAQSPTAQEKTAASESSASRSLASGSLASESVASESLLKGDELTEELGVVPLLSQSPETQPGTPTED